jgi:formylglycine-generating enzyme required for sulfatase activity/tRNA A-37 threonylcarbamoyl transferase component Bud32
MPVALETFLSQLSSSGIVPEEKLKVVVSKKTSFANGEALARDMIKSRLLTKYQAEQILGGKGKSLTMGKYQLLEKIGAGGMGQVYKAFHSGTERIVAIKVILGKGKIDPAVIKRFEREVKAAAKLVHSNIITVFDADQADGRIFMVMEYIKGDDLGELLRKKGQLSVSETVNYILQAARGLKYAHDQGVIHRDIKPGNILVDSSGNVKIVDMGLAKIEIKGNEEELSKLTADLSVMGTIDYMSPEQAESTKDVDSRADIYSLGATLYYLLMGEVLYPGKTIIQKILSHRESPIPSIRMNRPDVPLSLDLIFAKMVAKNVEDRYSSMAEIISALSRIEVEGGVSRIGTEDKLTVQFERGSYPETIDDKDFKTIVSEKLNKETWMHVTGKTVAYISGIFRKTKNHKVLAATGIIGFVLLVLMLLMKPGTNVNPKPNELLKKGLSSPGTPSKEEVEDLGKGIKLDLVLIPAGKFKMNNTHEVTLTKPYYMGKNEVTQEQWESVMGDNPSSTKGAKFPVTNVSWEDCQDFIKKLNAKSNGGYRLPTEAEWEYACRAGTSTAYSFGYSLTKSDANIEGGPAGSIKEVGSYKPNLFGLYDMHGNVWERCEDSYGDYPLGAVTDPKGSATAGNRVVRGGSFADGIVSAHSSKRHATNPTNRGVNHGFRLARSVDNKVEVVPPVLKPDPAAIMPATGNLLGSPFSEAKAKEVQKSVAKSLQKEVEEKADLGKGTTLEMVLIPAGKFKMGSPASEKNRSDNETQHEVTLTKPFYMGKYEVTQEQWESVMGDNPSSTKGAKLPVTGVSWKDCQGFIEKLNAKTSGGYRRPTEAEWEYACRAGTTTAYSFGDVLTKSDANCNESGGRIKEVGSYKPNAFGLYDMHGNVWEWCEDSYGDYPAGSAIDPKGPATGGSRVARGGSFNYGVSHARSSNRGLNSPTARSDDGGFRLARSVDIKAAVAPAIPNPKPAEVMPATGNLLVAPFTEAKAKEVQKSVAKSLQKEVEEKADLGKGTTLEMVLIPAGKFKMGSPASEQGRSGDETQHEVTLTKPFYMGKYEVTQEQWESVMGDNPVRGGNPSSPKGAKLPVTGVSWKNCQEFIKKLNANTDGGYRLPTEAEWEYACRAGTTTAYSFGNSLTRSDANYGSSSTKAVGDYPANAFGLYDMHGNVFEWCEDWYGDYPKGAVTDPKGPATGDKGVYRGGSFNSGGSKVRSSLRALNSPTAQIDYLGLRLARTP